MCSFHRIKDNSSFFIITTVYLITNQNELLKINLSCLIVTKENITKGPKFFLEKSYETKGNTMGFTAVYGHGVTGLLISIFKCTKTLTWTDQCFKFSIVLVMWKTSWILFNVCNVTETWKQFELTFQNGISSMPTDSQVHLTKKLQSLILKPQFNFHIKFSRLNLIHFLKQLAERMWFTIKAFSLL